MNFSLDDIISVSKRAAGRATMTAMAGLSGPAMRKAAGVTMRGAMPYMRNIGIGAGMGAVGGFGAGMISGQGFSGSIGMAMNGALFGAMGGVGYDVSSKSGIYAGMRKFGGATGGSAFTQGAGSMGVMNAVRSSQMRGGSRQSRMYNRGWNWTR